jgi:hypothetical protein
MVTTVPSWSLAVPTQFEGRRLCSRNGREIDLACGPRRLSGTGARPEDGSGRESRDALEARLSRGPTVSEGFEVCGTSSALGWSGQPESRALQAEPVTQRNTNRCSRHHLSSKR